MGTSHSTTAGVEHEPHGGPPRRHARWLHHGRKQDMIDRSLRTPSFVGRKRTILISPFAVTVTGFESLYLAPGTEPSEPVATGGTAADPGRIDLSTGAPIQPSVAAGDAASDSASLLSEGESIAAADAIRRRRQAVFIFDVNIPSLARTTRLRRTTTDFRLLARRIEAVYGGLAPEFPARGLQPTRIAERGPFRRQVMARKLKSYLSAAVELPHAMDCVALREFLELSVTSCDPRLGPRFKEGWLSTTSGTAIGCGDAARCVPGWGTRYWMVLRDNYLAAYADSRTAEPSQVVLLDDSTEVVAGSGLNVVACNPLHCGGAAGDPLTLAVRTRQGELLLHSGSRRDAEDWLLALRSRIGATPRTQPHALSSFAPPRAAEVRWCVDGRNTFATIVQAIKSAQYEIFMTGWWLAPGLDLVRDSTALAVVEGESVVKELLAKGSVRGAKPVEPAKAESHGPLHRHAATGSRTTDPTSGLQPPGHVDPALVRESGATDAAGAGSAAGSGLSRKPSLPHRAASALKRFVTNHRSSTPDSTAAPPAAATGVPAPEAPPAYPPLQAAQAVGSVDRGAEGSHGGINGDGVPTGAVLDTQADSAAGDGAAGDHRDGHTPSGSDTRKGHGAAASRSDAAAEDAAMDAALEGDPASMQLILKRVLKERADAGVTVYALMWQEPPMTLALSSSYQKQQLKALSPNVHVIRHGSPLGLWTHHEKIVCVDRRVAFIGGLDICWGRWDAGPHPVADPHRVFFPRGLEMYNPALEDWDRVTDEDTDRWDRTRFPRMSWHDVHMALRGAAPVSDVVWHFAQRWNFARADKNKMSLPVVLPHGPWDERVSRLLRRAKTGGLAPEYSLHDAMLTARTAAAFLLTSKGTRGQDQTDGHVRSGSGSGLAVGGAGAASAVTTLGDAAATPGSDASGSAQDGSITDADADEAGVGARRAKAGGGRRRLRQLLQRGTFRSATNEGGGVTGASVAPTAAGTPDVSLTAASARVQPATMATGSARAAGGAATDTEDEDAPRTGRAAAGAAAGRRPGVGRAAILAAAARERDQRSAFAGAGGLAAGSASASAPADDAVQTSPTLDLPEAARLSLAAQAALPVLTAHASESSVAGQSTAPRQGAPAPSGGQQPAAATTTGAASAGAKTSVRTSVLAAATAAAAAAPQAASQMPSGVGVRRPSVADTVRDSLASDYDASPTVTMTGTTTAAAAGGGAGAGAGSATQGAGQPAQPRAAGHGSRSAPPLPPSAYCSTDWTQMWMGANVQLLRSVGEWSAGTETENSIFNAYVHAILNARHSIWIEQQYALDGVLPSSPASICCLLPYLSSAATQTLY